MKKGLDALVGKQTGTPSQELFQVEKVEVELIDPSPANKRKCSDTDTSELADSIDTQGLLQAIIIRSHPTKMGRYELVAGERRWRAFRLKKWPLIPSVIRNLNDKDAHDITASENLQREDLSPIETSEQIQVMLADGRSAKEIADRIGKPESWVQRRARIADLSPKWLKAIADPKNQLSKWSATHLELIARYDHDMQDELFSDLGRGWDVAVMTVKDLEKKLNEKMLNLSGAPWKQDDETLLPAAGACAQCQKRTSCAPSLFEPIEDTKVKGDRCLDRECWGKKLLAYHEINIKKEREENKGLILMSKAEHASILPDGNALEKSVSHDSYKYEAAKKSDKKAVPVYVVEGPGAGKVQFLKVKKSYEDSKPSRPVGKDGKAAPKSMKERREALDKRRVIRFINKLMMLLRGEDMNAGAKGKPGTCRVCGCTETTPCVDDKSGDSCSWVEPDLCSACADRLKKKPYKEKKSAYIDPRLAIAENLSNIETFALVATFGAAPQDFDDDISGMDWDTYKKFSKMNGGDAMQVALYGAFDRIEDQLRQQTYGTPDVEFPNELCAALKLKRDEIWNAVLAEITEPKSWANLKADGTPKK